MHHLCLPAPAPAIEEQGPASFAALPRTGSSKSWQWRPVEGASYEASKQLQLLAGAAPASQALTIPALVLSPQARALVGQRPALAFAWSNFWGRRLAHLTRPDQEQAANVPAPFPGSLVSAAGVTGSGKQATPRYRGSFFWEQRQQLGATTWHESTLTRHHAQQAWPFPGIARPTIYCLEPRERIATVACPVLPPTPDPLLRQLIARIRNENAAGQPFLYELDAFAAFASCLALVTPVAAGVYGQTWLEVASAPVGACRASEFCLPERVLEELANLPARRFAPVVLNEHMCVTDGNHRLTAVWIWNMLHATLDCRWQLDNQTWQQALAAFAVQANWQPALGAEALTHLGQFAGASDKLARLDALRPALQALGPIATLPVTMLPEYLAGAVDKALYEKDGALVHISPQLYATIASRQDCLLPARLPYHFTDTVELPWFSLF